MAADRLDWLVTAAVASPHVLYAFIWLLPDIWLALFSKKSHRAVYGFECCAWFLKCKLTAGQAASESKHSSNSEPSMHAGIQGAALILWYKENNSAGLSINMETVALWQWVAFVALAGLGQVGPQVRHAIIYLISMQRQNISCTL